MKHTALAGALGRLSLTGETFIGDGRVIYVSTPESHPDPVLQPPRPDKVHNNRSPASRSKRRASDRKRNRK